MTTQTVPALTGKYTLDTTHSLVGFTARHAMVTKVRGQFTEFSGEGFFDFENPANSNVKVVIKSASIHTGNADRDGHLKGNDFFSMDEFPEITFASTSFVKEGSDTYKVTGDLTIKGTTKSIDIDFDYTGDVIDPWGNTRIGFEGKTTINRKDWGVNWNAALEAGGVLVSEKVVLELEVSAVKAADAA
ncbi:MAG: YceI family protein [Actinomycetota bacterium]